jgi:hypothetical protein
VINGERAYIRGLLTALVQASELGFDAGNVAAFYLLARYEKLVAALNFDRARNFFACVFPP